MSSLHWAARKGLAEDVAALIRQGADINAVSVRGFTPLMIAAQENHLPVVTALLDAGADVYAAHPNGRTALHLAASQGHLGIVQTLIARGASANSQSENGSTPALEAAQFNHEAVARYLLTQGTDASVRDNRNRTVDEWLALGGLPGAFAPLEERHRARKSTPEYQQQVTDQVRRFMAEGLTADEYAAKHGRFIYVWSYGQNTFTDSDVEQWARRVTEVVFTPALLEACEEQHLHGDELADARKRRAQRAKRAARRTAA